MTLGVFAKALVIAFCAALAASLYFAVGIAFVETPGVDFGSRVSGFSGFFAMCLLGSFAIGLPVSLLTFAFSWKHLIQSPTTLAMIAVLAGIMMVLTSYAILDVLGVRILGIPAFLAALTYGILGWFWILRPLRASEQP